MPKLPAVLETPKRLDASYLDGKLYTRQQTFELGEFLTNGSFGMIFKHADYIVKLEIRSTENILEMQLNDWASRNNFGPKFYAWGEVSISKSQFKSLIAPMKKRPHRSMPHWYDRLEDPTASFIVYYSIFEYWNSDLRAWRNKGTEDEFYNIDAKIMEKLATGIAELHKLGYIHLDLLAKNILVNTRTTASGKEEVIDIAITDFGNSIARRDWFDKRVSSESMRNKFVRYMLQHRELEDVGQHLSTYNPDQQPYSLCYFWLMYEPNNFDWAILTQYNIGPSVEKAMTVPYPKMPPRLIFGAPWLAAGVVALYVKRGARQLYLGQLNAFVTVAELRFAINQKLPELGRDFWIMCKDEEKYLPANKEQEPYFNISFAVQQSKMLYYVEIE